MTKLPVMTPKHPRWPEFANRLEGPEGCNFQPDKEKQFTWTCFGGYDKRFATAILTKMAQETPIDIAKSLKFFEANGGHCDCEILFNVSTDDDEEDEE